MSCIEKMSIQGIRSFGPEDQDKGIILFFKPLTLILGPNGTGKTTVIECLKYMTTGVMPPGSKGGAFVQDPKIAREREVKGQIKLQFRDVMGQKMTIQRIMLATQKLKKVEMRTLDGVITRLDATGEKKSISSKCAEIDREMITSLGVSKPVLENVIFCHQEESNWPLSEGKALKEKFDAIFASTRYVKALETIRKLKQTQDQDLKLYKQDSTYLKQHKDKASELEADLEEVQTKLMSSRDNIEKIDSKLTPIDEKLDQIATKSTKIYQIQTEITKLESERTIKQKAAEELKELIENEFQGSTSELRKELEEFGDAVQERQETIEQFQRKQAKLEKAIEKLTKEKNSLLMEVGKLEQEAERHKETVQRRDAHIRKVANDFHFEGFNRGEITEEKNKNFLDKIDHKVQRMADKARKAKAEFEEKELSLQRQIDKVREKKTKLEQSEKMKRQMVTENMNKIKQINRKLSEAEASAGRLDQITRDLKRAEHDLATTEESVNVEHLKQEIKDLTQKKNTQDAQISELSGEMNRLHLQSNSRAELDMLKKDKTAKEENIRRLKAKQEDTISYLIGHMPEHNIRGELDDYIGKQSDSVKKLSVELQKSKTQLATKEAEKKMFGDSLKKKEEEFGNLTERISSVCGSQNFDEGLSVLQEKMSQTQDQRGSLLGAEHFFEKYVVALEKKDPCCPLCHREFDTEQEVKELIIDLKDKLRLVPSKLQKAEKDLKEFNTKYDDMMQLKPLKENIETLSETEIPELKNKVKKLNEQIKNLKTEIEDKQEDLQTKEQDENMAKQIQPDVVTMDRYQGEVKELAKKITTESSKLTGGDSSKTLKDVISEKEELQMQVDTMNKMLDNKRQKINDHSEEVQSLKESINILREDKLKIDSDLQQRFKLEEDKTTFLRENDGHEEEIAKAKKDLRPLQSQIEKLQREKEEASKEKEDSLENMKTEIDSVKNKATKVKNLNQDIQGYTQLGKANTLNDKREHLEQIKSTTAEKEEEQKEYSRNLDKLRNDLAATEKTERELTDNLRLRKQMEDIKKLKSQIQEEQEKLGGIDVKNMDRERKRLMTQQGELMMDKQSAEGRQRELQGQISMIKKELQTDIYKDANNKYRDKMIQMRTTELASSDLEKYYKALDKAIMSYHNMKMDEINKIIRELWRNTYRGNDIETIEIRSDEDEAGLMKTRRTYNYRVVMVKGDTALDMRGRCSAGQKVLASLIIRMALAETFCLNCGILALDEPTTNLDRENIESLAYALVEIIKSRSNQKNFQLVVITHDEDFVELLGRSDYVDEFFKVRKDQNGCSKLVKAKVEDIHSR